MKIYLAAPRGFCAGVDRAIDVVEKALEIYGKPVYVRHQIVHNEHVISTLEQKGAVFVEDINDIPKGSVVIFSAHGIPPEVREEAKRRDLKSIDATCPLVTKVHLEAVRFHKQGYHIILIGKQGHQEVVGTMGHAPMDLVTSVADVAHLDGSWEKIACLTQTTLSVDDAAIIKQALVQKYPQIQFPPLDDICYATTNRQEAVKDIAQHVDLLLVVGGTMSSNSQKLVDTAIAQGVRSYLIQSKDDIQEGWFDGVSSIGISSGASTPDNLVEDLLSFLKQKFDNVEVETIRVAEEEITFRMPRELQ